MNLKRLLDEREELVELANSKDVRGARLLLKIAEKLAELELEAVETDPKLINDPIQRDLRYRLGKLSAYKQVAKIPELAQALVRQQEDDHGRSH